MVVLKKILLPLIFLMLGLGIWACNNPFAPSLADVDSEGSLLGNQKTVEGLFKNFNYAYTFKDTLIYGKLLHEDFTFSYKNYDKNGAVFTWGREDEMIATSRMFNAAQSIDLTWTDILNQNGDSLFVDITRRFVLKIILPNDELNLFGKATFQLTRKSIKEDWKILQWTDESKE